MQILSLWSCKGVPSVGFSRPFSGTGITAICQRPPEQILSDITHPTAGPFL